MTSAGSLFAGMPAPARAKLLSGIRLIGEALIDLAGAPEEPAATPAPTRGNEARTAKLVSLAAERKARIQALAPRMIELAGTMPVNKLASELGIGLSTLYALAAQHGVSLRFTGTRDDRPEISRETLEQLSRENTPLAVRARRVGLSVWLLRQKLRAAGLPTGGARPGRAWPAELVEEMKRLAGTMPVPELAKKLGVSKSALYSRASVEGVRLSTNIGWTSEKLADLRRLAGTMPRQALAEHLGVTLKALDKRASKEGISLATRGNVPEWRQRLPDLAGTMPQAELSELLGVSVATLGKAAQELGLSLRHRKASAPANTETETETKQAEPDLPAQEEAPPVPEPEPEAKEQETVADRQALELEESEAVREDPRNPTHPRPAASAPRNPRAMTIGTSGQGSKWVRLRHPDGRWLRMDGLAWLPAKDKAHSYLVKRDQLKAVLARFELARECDIVPEPEWRPRDIMFARIAAESR